MPRVTTLPESFPNIPDWMRRAAQVVNGILLGRTNNVYTVTLTPNAATTTITNAQLTADSVLLIEPVTANAAADFAAGIYQVASAGQVILNHQNNAAIDKSFKYVLVG